MTPATPSARALIWDAPVRIVHWLLAAAFVGALLTADTERLRAVHVQLGYTVLGLTLFRLAWGVVGSRYARFASFVTGPGAVWRYLRSIPTARPEHHTGHNPAGAVAFIGLLGLGLTTTVTGWLVYEDVGGEWLAECHDGSAYAMLALVGVHVAGVAVASVRHRENLVTPMITGWKRGAAELEIVRRHRLVGAAVLLAVSAFWAVWATSAGEQGLGAVSALTRTLGRTDSRGVGAGVSEHR